MIRGERIHDRYILQALLGRGGMAEVWGATDERLNREVAVKFLAPQMAEDPEYLVRFFSEAQSVARISHPHVIQVLDFGQHEERPLLVMEHAPGGSLDELLTEQLTIEQALELTTQVAEGVGAAHRLGLVHRDIKPGNILLDANGNAKIADFGISSNSVGESMTATGAAIGSPHYISPEQVSGRTATPASDVYSLGIVLYQLLIGRRPFEGDSVTAVAIAHVDRIPERPSVHAPEIEPWLDALVLRCLAKDPEARFADGASLAKAIRAADPGSYVPAAVLTSHEGSTDNMQGGAEEPLPTRPSLVSIGLILLLLGLASAGVVAAARRDSAPKPTLPPNVTAGDNGPSKAKRRQIVATPSSSGDGSADQEPTPTPTGAGKERKNSRGAGEEQEPEPVEEKPEPDPDPTDEPSSQPPSDPTP
ncbi:MAG: serine/threonine-protein kinase [Actinomycetota bacterium]